MLTTVIATDLWRIAQPKRGRLSVVVVAVLTLLSAVGGASELQLQTDVTALGIGDTVEVSLWLNLSANTMAQGVNAAGVTLSWNDRIIDLVDSQIVGAAASTVHDFISTPSPAVVLVQGEDAYHLASIHYDDAGIATFALSLLAARGAYSATTISSSVVPCASSGCGRFDLVKLHLRVSQVPTAGTVVSLFSVAPQYAQSIRGATGDSSATATLELASSGVVGAVRTDGVPLDIHFASGWDVATLSLSGSPLITSLNYTVLNEQSLQLTWFGSSGLVDGQLLSLRADDGQQATTITLRVDVVAEMLRATPSSSVVTAASTLVLIVEGFDADGNQDLDYQPSSSATLMVVPSPASVMAVRDLQLGGFVLRRLWAPVEGILQLSVIDGLLSSVPVELLLQAMTTQLQLQLAPVASLVAGSSFTVTVMGVDDFGVQDLDFSLSDGLLLQLQFDQ